MFSGLIWHILSNSIAFVMENENKKLEQVKTHNVCKLSHSLSFAFSHTSYFVVCAEMPIRAGESENSERENRCALQSLRKGCGHEKPRLVYT